MISSIGTAGFNPMQAMQSQGRPPEPPAMNDEQKQLVSDTLQGFDPENLSESEAQSIIETFAEAGIQPGKELESLMAEAGFDAKSVGEQAGMQPPPPPPQGGQGGVNQLNINEEMLTQLNDLLSSYTDDNLSDEEKAQTLDSIKSIFEQAVPEGGLVNISV